MWRIDLRNPLVHMFLWHVITNVGLVTFLFTLHILTENGRMIMFETVGTFFGGITFWLLVAVVAALISGTITGALVWLMTFSALISDKTISRHYFQVWGSLGFLLLLSTVGIAWWYIHSAWWQVLPLTAAPRIRDAMLAVVWMVVVPLIGATRFIDTLKADARQLRQKTSKIHRRNHHEP